MASRAVSVILGGVLVGFGVHQLVRPAKWVEYIPGPIAKLVPLDKPDIIKIHGSGNIAMGLVSLFLSRFSTMRWATAGWWLNVLILCGVHEKRAVLRDLPFFIAALKNTQK